MHVCLDLLSRLADRSKGRIGKEAILDYGRTWWGRLEGRTPCKPRGAEALAVAIAWRFLHERRDPVTLTQLLIVVHTQKLSTQWIPWRSVWYYHRRLPSVQPCLTWIYRSALQLSSDLQLDPKKLEHQFEQDHSLLLSFYDCPEEVIVACLFYRAFPHLSLWTLSCLVQIPITGITGCLKRF